MLRKLLKGFTTFDLVIIALLSAGGIATKPFVRLLTQIATGTLIPSGAVAGVIYMFWIVLACSITKKRGTAILVGIVQSMLVIVFDMLGNKGVANLLVYIMPGIALELVMLFFPRYVGSVFSGFVAGMVANATGTLIMGLIFMRLPVIPLAISLGIASFFGGIGGVFGFSLFRVMKRFGN